MKIHWLHNFKRDGFEQWGDFTIWKGKCECGSTTRSTSIYKTRGKSPTFKIFLIPAIAFLVLANIFVYMYTKGIYPFTF